jgi:hypothetical protein
MDLELFNTLVRERDKTIERNQALVLRAETAERKLQAINTDVRLAETAQAEAKAAKKEAADAQKALLVAKRELAAKECLLERNQAEADLSERLSAVQPVLSALHDSVVSLSQQTPIEGGTP